MGSSMGSPEPEAPERPSLADRLDETLLRLDLLRDRPLISSALVALAVLVVAGGWWLGRPASTPPVEADIPFVTPITPVAEHSAPGDPSTLIVHVAGAVRRPGIVELETGSRIVDAIEAAGGPTGSAELHRLNLAAPVADGMQVRVPVPGEPVEPAGSFGSGADGGGLVNVNTASAQELQELPGIGPALAQAIVDWRQENGTFGAADDLLAVAGIGPAKLAGLVDRITL